MNTPSERRSRAWPLLALISSAAAFSLVTLASAAAPGTPGTSTPPSSATEPETQNPKLKTSAPTPALAQFRKTIQPIFEAHCYECHADGVDKGNLALDKFTSDDQLLHQPDLWLKVLKNTRAGLMPADGHPRLSAQDQGTLDTWIKFTAFGLDPKNLDPGRITVHRLNRTEYRNTIHDLLGVDFDADAAFPGDDIGYGFDNIADVLNVSPLLMEKYLTAAQTIVSQVVPATSRVVPTNKVLGRDFIDTVTGQAPALDTATLENGKVARTAAKTSYFKEAHFTRTFTVTNEGDYRVVVEEGVSTNFTYVAQTCTIAVSVDGKEMKSKVLPWMGANSRDEKQISFYDTASVHWAPGPHEVTVSATPLSGVSDRSHDAAFLLRSVTIEGPADPAQWVRPDNYLQFFPLGEAPADSAARRAYARELLGPFATKAFRRPVPAETLDKLVAIAESVYSEPGKTFEAGVSQAMVAVLASPRFLFRIDAPVAATSPSAPFALVDDYSLASRLSYFLWSTMPDDELLKLAAAGQLRQNLAAQVKRMIADPRSDNFINNFSEQWLQSRAVTNVSIDAQAIYAREGYTNFTAATDDLTIEQRVALNQESHAYFGYIMRDDRNISEFLDSNYMFLNSTLATYYFGPGYKLAGPEMRKVELTPGDPHGGVLTMGSVLMVTSNPTRTSPVKRGKWILENILNAPAPPPPPNIPSLDDTAKSISGHVPSQREILAVHRADPNCSSCHDRMDPLGLALENFNALGTWRWTDMDQPIDSTGKLSSGESFKNISELKHILVTNHREEFYHCLTEKMLTYALGRGMDYYDIATEDQIVENLDKNDGHFSALLQGIITSAAFQEERTEQRIKN